MELYRHNVKYYETDRMGISHHSNYIRWMEEARIDYLEKIGCSYDKMESEGIISPVLSVSCDFKKSTTFSDVIAIKVMIKKFTGIRLVFGYEMINLKDNAVVCTAVSEHCFLNTDFKPLNLKKVRPEYYERLVSNS